MDGYYETGLAARRLRRCYEVAPPRVRRYLETEIAFTRERIRGARRALELGCGYGRVLGAMKGVAASVVGVDSSLESIDMARAGPGRSCAFAVMNAADLGLSAGVFDAVVCVQNGLSAFHQDPARVVSEAVRVAAPDATLVFSSYAEAFWGERLEWFRIQAREGLVGEIDEEATGNGRIVCRDGFTATTTGPDEFRALFAVHGVEPEVITVDDSSLFCVATV